MLVDISGALMEIGGKDGAVAFLRRRRTRAERQFNPLPALDGSSRTGNETTDGSVGLFGKLHVGK